MVTYTSFNYSNRMNKRIFMFYRVAVPFHFLLSRPIKFIFRLLYTYGVIKKTWLIDFGNNRKKCVKKNKVKVKLDLISQKRATLLGTQ